MGEIEGTVSAPDIQGEADSTDIEGTVAADVEVNGETSAPKIEGTVSAPDIQGEVSS